MTVVDVTFSAAAPVDSMWAVLADFGAFLDWAGEGEIRVEGEGIGMIRHLDMGGAQLAERLLLLDHDKRQISYDIVSGEPIGMKTYCAVVEIRETGDGVSEIQFHGEFDVVEAGTEDQVSASLTAAFEGMTTALVAYVTS